MDICVCFCLYKSQLCISLSLVSLPHKHSMGTREPAGKSGLLLLPTHERRHFRSLHVWETTAARQAVHPGLSTVAQHVGTSPSQEFLCAWLNEGIRRAGILPTLLNFFLHFLKSFLAANKACLWFSGYRKPVFLTGEWSKRVHLIIWTLNFSTRVTPYGHT